MKNKGLYVIVGIIIGIVLCIGIPLLMLDAGAINMGATTKPGVIERNLAPWAVDHSRESRAPHETNSYTNADDVATGLDHYRENCVMCHGAPDVAAGELAKGLNPGVPDLQSQGTQSMSDGELFWTIKHGIRMTAMPAFAPTHTDSQIWKIVAFVRHLPNLTDQEKAELRSDKKQSK